MVGETVLINATASSGLMNLSSQLPTLGTISGIGLLVVLLFMAFAAYIANAANTKNSWLNRLMRWLNEVGAFKAVIGGWTVGFLYGCYLVSGWFGSSDGQGSIRWLAQMVGWMLLGFMALIAVGYVAEPAWRFVWKYITATKVKEGKHD